MIFKVKIQRHCKKGWQVTTNTHERYTNITLLNYFEFGNGNKNMKGTRIQDWRFSLKVETLFDFIQIRYYNEYFYTTHKIKNSDIPFRCPISTIIDINLVITELWNT